MKRRPVRLLRDVYSRDDGTPGGSIQYEQPGKLMVGAGTVGRFEAKTDKGVIVSFDNGVGSVLRLLLEESVVERA